MFPLQVSSFRRLYVVWLKCLGWDGAAWTELPLNRRRAELNQTQPPCTQTSLSTPPFTFVPSILHSSRRPKPPTPTIALPPPNTQSGEWCLLYPPPLPSLWGRKHFDRTVFMACWTGCWNESWKEPNHLAGCSFILSAGQLCGSARVWPAQRE